MASLTVDGTDTITWSGGKGVFLAQGTFGSGTMDLQFSTDGGTTKTSFGSDTTLTAAGGGAFIAGAGDIYVDLSGSTTPTITYVVLPAEGENLPA